MDSNSPHSPCFKRGDTILSLALNQRSLESHISEGEPEVAVNQPMDIAYWHETPTGAEPNKSFSRQHSTALLAGIPSATGFTSLPQAEVFDSRSLSKATAANFKGRFSSLIASLQLTREHSCDGYITTYVLMCHRPSQRIHHQKRKKVWEGIDLLIDFQTVAGLFFSILHLSFLCLSSYFTTFLLCVLLFLFHFCFPSQVNV